MIPTDFMPIDPVAIVTGGGDPRPAADRGIADVDRMHAARRVGFDHHVRQQVRVDSKLPFKDIPAR